ncbi:hypothetical protein [Flavobacterium sp. KJJ]|uniref:hypothetical protein n=1 Tax=Flavobacterium sp. KJJ TaxID=1270193 RepID=UPI0004939B27|nr:hypothetical protein [Flavobacterium sp. KJJ]
MKNSVIINFSPETVEVLNKGNYSLCCFLSSKTDNASLFTPLCWSVIKGFLQSVLIEWEDNLCAYLSTSDIIENQVIYIPQAVSAQNQAASKKAQTGSSYKIDLNERMLIENYGKVTIDGNNDLNNVLIQNNSNNPYSTGLCIYNTTDEQYYGNCVFNTYGGNTIKVIPVNKAFLMFSSKDIENNTVILNAENSGILVDLTASEDNSRTVSYDINNGWSSDKQVWGKQYPAGTDLKALLLT